MTEKKSRTTGVYLETLVDALKIEELRGNYNPEALIAEVTADSRRCAPGTLFVATRGVNVDSHRFVPSAIAAGAEVIVVEEIPVDTPENILFIRVSDSREALGLLASRFYGDPSESLILVGVTGTNGKTTIATLLYEMARMRGLKAGLLSTVVNIVDTEAVAAEHTTPDAVQLNALLRRMVDAGCTFAAMEVSSHAADQHRIAGLDFDGAIFTNLTRDHLDYHKTFADYLKAKQSFFDMLKPHAFALTNIDDRNGDIIVQNTTAKRYTYSCRSLADFMAKPVEERLDGTLVDFNGKEVETMFVGRFNVANLAAVYGASVLLGYPADEVLVDMSRLVPVAGRFQPFRSASGITAIVDYAHTPDALINVLDTISELVPDGTRVITVCGAGGNRDHGKRPLMAKAAAERSDLVILTSDNPRHEDPEAIIADMLAGLKDDEKEKTLSIVDRSEAIGRAAAEARTGDVILIAGKGHETEQVIGDVAYHFDDREEICRFLGITNR